MHSKRKVIYCNKDSLTYCRKRILDLNCKNCLYFQVSLNCKSLTFTVYWPFCSKLLIYVPGKYSALAPFHFDSLTLIVEKQILYFFFFLIRNLIPGDQDINISDPRITLEKGNKDVEGSQLIIANANFDDRAEYTCNATNEISSANVTILVRVKGKISIFFKLMW